MLRDLKPSQASYVYDSLGNKIACFAKEYRRIIPQDEIPPVLERAILAAEDKNFYSHRGLDWVAILRAAKDDILAGRIVSGGSTLTQQVARGMFLSPERNLNRKIKEALLALKIERYFTKREILWLYINMVYLGHGRYGFEAASQFYFGKSVYEINLNQTAMLAGLINSPERSSPYRDEQTATLRRNRTLKLMLENGFIGADEYEKTIAEPLEILLPMSEDCKNLAPYFVEEIRQQFGDMLPILTGGLHIFTRLDVTVQKKIEDALRTSMDNYLQRHPENADELRGGVIVIDLASGGIIALQGGDDFKKNQYNCATQCKRQPGSAFKPFTYAAALEIGWNKAILDQPVTLAMGSGKFKIVQNYPYEHIARYRGWISFETAVAESRNAATVWLVKQIGVGKVVEVAKRLGIQSELQPYPTTSIGASEVTLLELTAALMPTINGGYKLTPFLVSEIYDGAGKLLYKAEIKPEKVLEDNVAEKIKKLMQAVVEMPTGTAHRLRNTIKNGELAGKTGTATNEKGEATDNWFIGFTPRYAIGVWLGLDSKKPLGNRETGGRNALPVFEKIVAELKLVNPDEIFTPLLPKLEEERPQ